ncbi:hypothetical protein M3B43_11860 [Nesterenkonia massiliensis]|uniref:Trm112 family protein n=1 Tax=Nesterenkonia massiliensis TaxID=1232429 RepID=A0ABT2HTG6_9MICC|nr:Trm112 family protein [Nesterenkonia massiliensis]MCT1607996.1 hypothetical protein [Nesterenkonia massiliensis]
MPSTPSSAPSGAPQNSASNTSAADNSAAPSRAAQKRAPERNAPLTDDILQILRCPVTGSPLRQEGDELIATEDPQRRYRIEDGVPHLLPHNA